MVARPAAAQDLHPFDLPAGPLMRAVVALGQQADISISIADPRLRRIRVKRVRGTMSVETALRRMLAESGADFVALAGSNYRIVRAAPRRSARPVAKPGAPGEPDPVPQGTDIVVTGSKRQIRLRHYPGPVTMIAGDELEGGAAGAGTDAISERIPSLGSTHLGPGRDKLFVRAVADSSFSGQTQATVGQYLGEARLNYNAPDPSLRLYDVASVELLPGPQGTLYGSGSMGGVLRVAPNPPDTASRHAALSGSLAFTRHGDISQELAGVINLPLAGERGAVRLVAYGLVDGGYIDDVERRRKDINRTRIGGARLSSLWTLDDRWNLEAGGLFQSIEGRDSQYAERPDGDLARSGYFAQPFSNDYALAYATLRGEIGPYRLVSTVSGSEQDLTEHFEYALPQPGLLRQRNRLSLQSAEARLSRSEEDGTGWLVGASLVRNHTHLTRATGIPGDWTPMPGIRNSVGEQTLFGELTRRITGPLKVTGGARLTHVRFSGRIDGSSGPLAAPDQSGGQAKWRMLPSLAASLDIARDGLLYLRYQQGFRPGGVILRSSVTQLLESDRVAAWELGMRYGAGRIRAAVAFSHARWEDVQADLIDTVGDPMTINAGEGTVRSVEASLDWTPARGLDLRAAGTFNRSRLSQPGLAIIPLDDDPLPNVPRVVARGEAEYGWSAAWLGEMRLSASARYVGKSRLGVGPVLGRPQGEYLDIGAEARIGRADRFLFVKATNLLDTAGNRFALGSVLTIIDEDQVTPLRPRTVRLGVHAAF